MITIVLGCFNFLGRSLIRSCLLILLSVVHTIALATPSATLDDYHWVVLETTGETVTDHNCYDDLERASYETVATCVYDAREKSDNTLSKEWGLEDKVVREKDTLYVTVPQRRHPLAFVDYMQPSQTDYEIYYRLYDYDHSTQLLQIHQSLYESDAIALVNLQTGFWQEFYARKLVVSPNRRYIVGFESEPGATDDIVIWAYQDQGYHRGYYQRVYDSSEDRDIMDAYRDFYHVDQAHHVYNAETITWQDESSFYVDSLYQLNREDTAAFRIRYEFKLDQTTGNWSIVKQDH